MPSFPLTPCYRNYIGGEFVPPEGQPIFEELRAKGVESTKGSLRF